MWNRRHFIVVCGGAGLSGTLLPGVLYTLAQGKPAVTKDLIDAAAKIADVTIADEYKDAMLSGLNNATQGYDAIYKMHMDNSVQPALVFDPLPMGWKLNTAKTAMRISAAPAIATKAPKNIEDVAFYTVRQLAELVQTRKVSSMALTEMYLERLKKYDEKLKFVINLTEDRAKTQAKEADKAIAAGKYRGPLHGIPWGAKDLLAVKGYPTTWGAGGFENQVIDEDATVVQRLDKAGAVLVAKLTLGALAQGDRWFKGMTRNPWNPNQGSSGSSAGPASATAAGCVGFGIGTETLGSISSPSTRCGVTGLRPTFGFVPRTGAMALSWSMDKIGPICRSVEDCAMVLSAIYGPDEKDRSVQPAAFNWDASASWRTLRVGFLEKDFQLQPLTDNPPPKPLAEMTDEEKTRYERQQTQRRNGFASREYDHKFDVAALDKLRAMGVKMKSVELPDFPMGTIGAMRALLQAEAAAAFDELTRSGRDKLLTEQGPGDWPNAFRTSRFMPAVEYIQANRARMLLIEATAKVFKDFDVIVAPTNGGQLTITNLTGNPSIILPNGLRGPDAPKPANENQGGGPGTPLSLTFLGNLYGDAKVCTLARAYQEATGFHLQHPKLDA
ncbi:MAG TPA: amidase [Candidatus Acidoferrales bacterium]|nr:amidase [Candidatus Acidoferrales bacterium]